MKGLFLAFGLIAALFISDVHSSIYDDTSYQSPEQQLLTEYKCTNSSYTSGSLFIAGSYPNTTQSKNALVPNCDTVMEAKAEAYFQTQRANGLYVLPKAVRWYGNNSSSASRQWYATAYNSYPNNPYGVLTYDFTAAIIGSTTSSQCDEVYNFQYDSNNDGIIDRCYNPAELDNASKCSDLFNSGSILTSGSNTAPLVCKTFEDGSRCAFSLVNQGSTPYYQPNLEKGCFGDAEQIPDYDKNANEPQPQPEQCVPYAGGYACAADPKNYCSSEFECVDGCGYVNGQFICFRDEQCTGASCEPAPVDCTTVPDAPVCKEQQTTPEPSFCEKNPTVESCQSGSNFCKKNPLAPSCQLGGDNGGGGGGGFDFTLDYDRLINGMKDAAKTLIDESPIPDNTEMDKSLDDENKAIKSDYDTFLEDGVFNEIKATSQRTVFASLENIFPAGSSNCSFTMGEFTIEVCSSAEKIRGLLYWVFAILTLIYLRHLFYSTISINAGK